MGSGDARILATGNGPGPPCKVDRTGLALERATAPVYRNFVPTLDAEFVSNTMISSSYWNKMWHRWAAVVTTMDVKKECECCGLPALQGILNACGISKVFHPCVVMVISGAADFVSVHFFLVAFGVSAASGWWCMAAQQIAA